MAISERIRNAREKAGLTQKQLAEKAGIATITLQQYESGKRQPRLGILQNIAIALDITTGELLGPGNHKFTAEVPVIYNNDTNTIAFYFTLLNELGQKTAVERVHELTELPKYRKAPPQDTTKDGE